LWIKRDDLTGLGGGGNKVRKLEYTCGAALANEARTLVTVGAAQSNHARLTAAAGAHLGLDVVLMLAGKRPALATGNIALNGLSARNSFRLAGRASWQRTAMLTAGRSCSNRRPTWLTSSLLLVQGQPWRAW
jgi:1-aminocyclopropane-1-carboxylate deaminase/D-cysteine desulfhydrase-like pyridoxal-dependent ACC family enzyme